MSEVLHLRPDPQSTKSPLIISSPDFATLRIIPFINNGDWKVIQEYRDKTVLKGFASLGGLLTFFVSCTIWLFGTWIITEVFGTCYVKSTSMVTDNLETFRNQTSHSFWEIS